MANDSNPSALYRNRHDGTFEDIGVAAGCAYSQDGKPQAGMGVGIGDFDRNGWLDIVKTNFAGDTSSLYANTGQGRCEDQTFDAGLGLNTRWLGWGAGFADFDNDGWLDIFLTNGHVYPEVRQIRTEVGYEQRKVVYRNLGGRFDDVTMRLGAPATTPKAGRGTAFGDLDDNGTIDVVINNIHDTPDVFLTTATAGHHWLAVRLIGTRSNRNAIGARVRVTTGQVTQIREVQGGGSYLSQNDLRVHVGLGAASVVDRIEVRWPNGLEETWTGVDRRSAADAARGRGEGAEPMMPVLILVALLGAMQASPPSVAVAGTDRGSCADPRGAHRQRARAACAHACGCAARALPDRPGLLPPRRPRPRHRVPGAGGADLGGRLARTP